MDQSNILLVLGVLLLLFFAWNMYFTYSEIVYAESDIDKRMYMMRRGHRKTPEFLKDSANALAQINQRVTKLIEILENKYSQDSTKNYFISKLKENYNPYMISEAEVDPKFTTYTIDKNEMRICLRTRDTQEKIYDINLLMYVVLHELAHVCNYTQEGEAIQGHGPEFKRIFRFLVLEAIDSNLYVYTDYSKTPVNYCGLSLSTNIL